MSFQFLLFHELIGWKVVGIYFEARFVVMLLDGWFNIVSPFQFLFVQVPPFFHMHNQFNNCNWHDRGGKKELESEQSIYWSQNMKLVKAILGSIFLMILKDMGQNGSDLMLNGFRVHWLFLHFFKDIRVRTFTPGNVTLVLRKINSIRRDEQGNGYLARCLHKAKEKNYYSGMGKSPVITLFWYSDEPKHCCYPCAFTYHVLFSFIFVLFVKHVRRVRYQKCLSMSSTLIDMCIKLD